MGAWFEAKIIRITIDNSQNIESISASQDNKAQTVEVEQTKPSQMEVETSDKTIKDNVLNDCNGNLMDKKENVNADVEMKDDPSNDSKKEEQSSVKDSSSEIKEESKEEDKSNVKDSSSEMTDETVAGSNSSGEPSSKAMQCPWDKEVFLDGYKYSVIYDG